MILLITQKTFVRLNFFFYFKLEILQNRAVRITIRQGYNIRSENLLKSIVFKNLHKERMQQICSMMYKVRKKLVTSYLSETHKF